MSGLLNGSRTRSYGSLVRSPLSPVRQRRVEHNIQPEDTLQGLSLKYGVSMEQIKRANRLYTNESIFLKRSLWIPVLSDVDRRSNWVHVVGEDREEEAEEEAEEEEDDGSGRRAAAHGLTGSSSDRKQSGDRERTSDLTPVDFFKRLDGLISQSKHAAVKGCQDAEKRVAAIEAACGVSSWRPFTRSQSAVLSSRAPQQQQQQEEEESHVGVPRTIIKLAKTLRDREDEIFQL